MGQKEIRVTDTYIENWFINDGLKNFELILPEFIDKEVKFLQIGAYTGDASLWIVDNILTNPNSVLIDIDTWEGSDEPSHKVMNWSGVETFYDAKTMQARNSRKILKIKNTSDWFFKNNLEKFDFIYVDGDHTAQGVIKDAVNSFDSLKVGGVLAFDDYLWSAGLGTTKEPRMAIDAFKSIYSEHLETLVDGYQMWFRKKQ